MVIDNLDEDPFPTLAEQIINDSWVSKVKVSLIITSRLNERELESQITFEHYNITKNINLKSFNKIEGRDFLIKKSDIPANYAEIIAEKVDGHPLCLDQVANYLNLRKNCNMQNYMKSLEDIITGVDKKLATNPAAGKNIDRSRLQITAI